jgi:hypothetical protein
LRSKGRSEAETLWPGDFVSKGRPEILCQRALSLEPLT